MWPVHDFFRRVTYTQVTSQAVNLVHHIIIENKEQHKLSPRYINMYIYISTKEGHKHMPLVKASLTNKHKSLRLHTTNYYGPLKGAQKMARETNGIKYAWIFGLFVKSPLCHLVSLPPCIYRKHSFVNRWRTVSKSFGVSFGSLNIGRVSSRPLWVTVSGHSTYGDSFSHPLFTKAQI